jgi:hypothetical protein
MEGPSWQRLCASYPNTHLAAFSRPIPATAHRVVARNIANATPHLRLSSHFVRAVAHLTIGAVLGLIAAAVLIAYLST